MKNSKTIINESIVLIDEKGFVDEVDEINRNNCDKEFVEYLEKEIAKMKTSFITVSVQTDNDSRDTASHFTGEYIRAKNFKKLAMELDNGASNANIYHKLFGLHSNQSIGKGFGVVVKYSNGKINTFKY